MHIKVLVIPKAKKERIVNKTADIYEIQVKEPAEHNQANLRVRELLAEIYSINKGKVRLISGHRSPHKKFDVTLET